jgi:hypothetical protein
VVGQVSPEMSMSTVLLPLELAMVPKPVAGRQVPAVEIVRSVGVVSTLSSKVNEPLLKP